MLKAIAIASVAAGAFWLVQAPATAATIESGVKNDTAVKLAVTEDVSARRKRRVVRVVRSGPRYTYPGPTPYGYYGPVYYERPYARPSPFLFGFPSYW
ncbi:MAG: hypothetical protein JOZ70_01590 [Pseudolabrys sp.]|nr:hypothetical protein [Pseudolabrys sp.]MBV9953917.1 hypothetical protein [Pseudolabrys sp.]